MDCEGSSMVQNVNQVIHSHFVPPQAYDVAACKFRGRDALTNFPLENYDCQLEQLAQVTKAELVQVNALRV